MHSRAATTTMSRDCRPGLSISGLGSVFRKRAESWVYEKAYFGVPDWLRDADLSLLDCLLPLSSHNIRGVDFRLRYRPCSVWQMLGHCYTCGRWRICGVGMLCYDCNRDSTALSSTGIPDGIGARSLRALGLQKSPGRPRKDRRYRSGGLGVLRVGTGGSAF